MMQKCDVIERFTYNKEKMLSNFSFRRNFISFGTLPAVFLFPIVLLELVNFQFFRNVPQRCTHHLTCSFVDLLFSKIWNKYLGQKHKLSWKIIGIVLRIDKHENTLADNLCIIVELNSSSMALQFKSSPGLLN